MTTAEFSACDFEMSRYRQMARFRALYTWLVFFFSVVLTGVLALAVAFATHKHWLEAIVTGTTSVVAGSGVKFLLAQRKEARKEEEAQAEVVRAACPVERANEAHAYGRGLKVLGLE